MDTFFVGWGGLALINAALANIDGRSPLKYFLGSLLLGPLITLMLATTREADYGISQVDLWRGRAKPIPPSSVAARVGTIYSVRL
jgi:hypothetical protein